MTFEKMQEVVEEIKTLKGQKHELTIMIEIQEEFKAPIVISNEGYENHHKPLSPIVKQRLLQAVKDETEHIDIVIEKLTLSAGLDF